MNQSDAKRIASRFGLAWKDVLNEYRAIRQMYNDARQFECQIRQQVWSNYAWTVGSRPFWRHGTQSRFSKAFGEGDMAMIPGWDLVAQEVGMPSDELFEFIGKPFTTLPDASSLWADTFHQFGVDTSCQESIDAMNGTATTAATACPF